MFILNIEEKKVISEVRFLSSATKKCDISNDLENNFGCFVFNSRNWWLHLFGLIFRLFLSNRSLSKSHCFKPFLLSSLSLSLSFFKPFLTTFYHTYYLLRTSNEELPTNGNVSRVFA